MDVWQNNFFSTKQKLAISINMSSFLLQYGNVQLTYEYVFIYAGSYIIQMLYSTVFYEGESNENCKTFF
jgi:hypothetical protein